jgi:hypothetical protein
MAATKWKLVFSILMVSGLLGWGRGSFAQTAGAPTKDRPPPASPPRGASGGESDVVLTHLAGVVRDSNRKPIAGATVSLSGTDGYYETRAKSAGTGRGTSDAGGHYRLSFYTRPGGSVEVLGVRAEARGFVRADVHFREAKPVLRPGATTELNFELARGEVLAGVAVVGERLRDRLMGVKPGEKLQIVRVRSASFTQVFATQPGGAFEVWVPRSVYSLELLADLDTPVARLEKVASGTRDLNLEKVDPPIAADVLGQAFDALWSDMARHYSYFELKKVDWESLKTRYRARAVAAGTLPRFVDVLGEMLGELQDGHVRFIEPCDAVVNYWPRGQRIAGNFEAVEKALQGAEWVGNGFARVGTTRADGFGVVRITRQSRADEAAVKQVVAFIRAHADVPGFIVDLRGADGGNELLAQLLASEFCDRATVYAKSKYRNGPRPTDFGPEYDRQLEPAPKPFTRPVVCILGPGCVSSGEGMAQMLVCLPQVTSVGLPTRGSSGNPKAFKLPGVPVTVAYSRWVDLMPSGQPIEGRGIPPQIRVDLPDSAFEKTDPIWDKAVGTLRGRTKKD